MTRGINYLCGAHYYLPPMSTLLSSNCRWVGGKRRKCYLRWGLKAKEIFFGRTFLSTSRSVSNFKYLNIQKGHRDRFLQISLRASALSSLQSYQYLPHHHHHLTLNKFTPSLSSSLSNLLIASTNVKVVRK